MTIQATAARANRLLARATTTAASAGRTRARDIGALDHAAVLADNGFIVFHGLFSPTECAETALM